MSITVEQGHRVQEGNLSDLPRNIKYRRHQAWKNWGQTAHCKPEFSFYPKRLEDLIQIVNFARNRGRKIRVAASGHSWSTLVPTDDILVYVHGLNKVDMDFSDTEHPRVVMECGATVQEVNDVLEQHGYALPLNVVLESVRFGGLIATGSHGSGWENSTLSDLVYAVDVVTASGEVRRFETGVDDEDVMRAVRLNLGMFGIMHRISMNVQKNWHVRARDQRLPIADVMNNLQEWVPSNDNMDLFWWPFSDQLWVKSWHRIDAPITAKPRKSLNDRIGTTLSAQFYRQSLRTMKTFPRSTPNVSRMLFNYTPSVGDKVVDVVEAIHYRRSIEVAKMGCAEVAFKLDTNFDNVRWAMQSVFERVNSYARRNEYPMNVTMNVRFIRSSNCWLSPASGDGHTCYIEILSFNDQKLWDQFSGEVASDWMTLPQARPHWAKEFQHIPNIIPLIKKNYGENIQHFNRIKSQLQVDPHDMFLNPTLKEIFS